MDLLEKTSRSMPNSPEDPPDGGRQPTLGEDVPQRKDFAAASHQRAASRTPDGLWRDASSTADIREELKEVCV